MPLSFFKTAKAILRSRLSFTLIELLIVIAVIAVLATVVILVLNPAELLMRSRDANRISDVQTLTKALSLYEEDTGKSMGQASTTYVSIPDPLATSTLGDQCQGLGLPTLTAGDTYHCAASSTYRNVNGTGWIPVDMRNASFGSPLSSLPVDPVNQTSTGLYYTYTTDGSKFELTALMESSKYQAQFRDDPAVTGYPGIDAKGTDLTLSELYDPNGLVGYWKLDEGTGTIAYDLSGSGDNGTLVNDPTWKSSGCFNSDNCLLFNGGTAVNGSYVNVPNSPSLHLASGGQVTLMAWVNPNGTWPANDYNRETIITKYYTNYELEVYGVYHKFGWGSSLGSPEDLINNAWQQLAITFNNGTAEVYLNSKLVGTLTGLSAMSDNSQPLKLAYEFAGWNWTFAGYIENARVYNRALSPAEIWAVYNLSE